MMGPPSAAARAGTLEEWLGRGGGRSAYGQEGWPAPPAGQGSPAQRTAACRAGRHALAPPRRVSSGRLDAAADELSRFRVIANHSVDSSASGSMRRERASSRPDRRRGCMHGGAVTALGRRCRPVHCSPAGLWCRESGAVHRRGSQAAGRRHCKACCLRSETVVEAPQSPVPSLAGCHPTPQLKFRPDLTRAWQRRK